MFLVNSRYPYLRNWLPVKFQKWRHLYPVDVDDIDVSGMTDIDIRLASSRGMDINVLSVDENTVVVNKRAVGVRRLLERHGFTVIDVQLEHCEIFGGGIHCSTLDLVREDSMEDYTC
jgi:glycine amidinotransferase